MADLSLHRLNEFAELDADEISRFHAIPSEEFTIAHNRIIRREGDPVDCVYLLTRGWVISCVGAARGRRQIVKIHLPGDMMGAPSVVLSEAAETLESVGVCTYRRIDLADFGRLILEAPRIGARLFLSTQQERVILMDRIAAIGAASADRRLAALLLHLYDRLCLLDPAQTPVLHIPLTQVILGEATGLTSIHVNRTLRKLQADGLIAGTTRAIELRDIPGLRKLSGIQKRQWRRADWLFGAPADGTA